MNADVQLPDQYIVDQIPSWTSDISGLVRTAPFDAQELLALMEHHFGPIEEVLERLDTEQERIREWAKTNRPPNRFKDEHKERTKIHLEIDDRVERGATVLWYDLFHPESPLRVHVDD